MIASRGTKNRTLQSPRFCSSFTHSPAVRRTRAVLASPHHKALPRAVASDVARHAEAPQYAGFFVCYYSNMPQNEHRDLVIDGLKKQYQKEHGVLGMVLFGSQAQGRADEFSDIDAYVILSKDDGRERIFRRIHGVRVDILFDSIKSVTGYVKSEEGKFWRNVSHMLASGTILFFRSPKLLELQRRAKRNMKKKTRLERNEKLLHLYSIEDYWHKVQRDEKNRDVLAFQRNASHIINNAVELLLKEHGDYLPPARELDAKLKQIDPTFRNRLHSFYKARDLQKQFAEIRMFVRYVTKCFGQVPDEWVVKKKTRTRR